MYDSFLQLAVRRGRRIWPILLVIVLIAVAGSLYLSSARSRVQVEQSVRISRTAENAVLLGIGGTSDVDPREIAYQADSEYEVSDHAAHAAISSTPDTLASLVHIVAVATTQSKAEAALDAYIDIISARSIGPRLESITERAALVEQQLADIDTRIADLESVLTATTSDAIERGILIVDLAEARSERVNTADKLRSTKRFEEFVTNDLIQPGERVVEGGSGSLNAVASGVFVGLVLAGALLALVTVIDRRVLRRIHVERALPDRFVAGTLPLSGARRPAVASLAKHAILNQVAEAETTHVAILGVGAPDAEAQLADLIGDDAPTSCLAGELPDPDELVPSTTMVLLAATSAKTTETALSAADAALSSAGYDNVIACLVNVPARDLSWASLSARSFASEVQS